MLSIADVRRLVEEFRAETVPFEQRGLPPELADRINPVGKFELVLNDSTGKYVFIPVSRQMLLFRGQAKEIVPCLPTIYRGKPSKWQQFTDRVRLVEFEHLLNSHPLVRDVFLSNNWTVDYEGLAQHYCLRSELLDFTSSLDVALFFAMSRYDASTDTYYPAEKDGEAIIYVINPLFFDRNAINGNKISIYSHLLTPIGIQPFERPAAQHGFALRVDDPRIMNRARVFEFRYTKKEAEECFSSFESARKLWVKDELISKVQQIRTQGVFSTGILEEAWNRFPINGETMETTRRMLALRGVRFADNAEVSGFSQKECGRLLGRLQHRLNQLQKRIVSRKYVTLEEGSEVPDESGGFTAKIKEQRDCIALNEMASLAILNLVSHGRTYPEGTRPAKTAYSAS